MVLVHQKIRAFNYARSNSKDEELFGLPAEELLYRLYHEETVNLYPAQDVNFSVAALLSVLVLHYCSSLMKKLTKY